MLFSGTYMKLEITVLSEISQTQKYKYYVFSCICKIYSSRSGEMRIREGDGV